MHLRPNKRYYYHLDEAASRLNLTVGDLLHYAKTGSLELCCYLTKRELKNHPLTVPDNCINKIGLNNIINKGNYDSPPSKMMIRAGEEDQFGGMVMDLSTRKIVDIEALLAIPARFVTNLRKDKHAHVSVGWLALPTIHRKPELTEFGWIVGGKDESLQLHFNEPIDIFVDELFITNSQMKEIQEYLDETSKPETIHEKRQRFIIQHIKEMEIDPLNFPFKNGARTPKADLKDKLVDQHPKLFTESTFDKAWEDLRLSGEIKNERRRE